MKKQTFIIFAIVFCSTIISLINGQGCSVRKTSSPSLILPDMLDPKIPSTIPSSPDPSNSNGGGYGGIQGIFMRDNGPASSIAGGTSSNSTNNIPLTDIVNTFTHFNANLQNANFNQTPNYSSILDGIIYQASGQFIFLPSLSSTTPSPLTLNEIIFDDYNINYLLYNNQIFHFNLHSPQTNNDLIDALVYCSSVAFLGDHTSTEGLDIVILKKGGILQAQIIMGGYQGDKPWSFVSDLFTIQEKRSGSEILLQGISFSLSLPITRGIAVTGQAVIQFTNSSYANNLTCFNEKL